MSNSDRSWIGHTIGHTIPIIAVLLGFSLGYLANVQPDFTVSVHPIVISRYAPTEAKATINIEDIHPIYPKYQNQIILDANIINNPPMLSDISFSFEPTAIDPKYSGDLPIISNMRINIGRNATAGKYKIKIEGIGGDGKERSTTLILDVIPPQLPMGRSATI